MAMSLPRPDPSVPASVADAAFPTSRRGFDQAEVRDFLRMVAAELGRLQERERFLERELRSAQTNPDLSSVPLDEEAFTRVLGEESARVLTTAREAANEIRQKAEQSAAQLLSEAGDEAARLREEAEVEASRRRSDAASDAEAELAMAKQQGREMVNEARAYRERVLSELARRRELAREQIEQLLHGRDRLVQSFERARLAAVDVISELQPLGEPDEYVNLSPTTGPVPVMVPNAARRATEPALAPAEADVESDADATADDTVVIERHLDAVADVEVDTEVDADVAEPTVDDTVVIDLTPDDEADAEVEPAVDIEPEIGTEIDAATEPSTDIEAEIEAEELEVEAEIAAGDVAVAEADETAADAAPERDDVVVDLFARLRASTDTPDDAIAEADVDPAADEPDADPTADDEIAVGDSSFEQRDAALTPLIVACARRIKRVLADEQNEVLDVLRGRDAVRAIDALVPEHDAHLARYRAAIADELRDAAAAGAASMQAGDGTRPPEAVLDAARERAGAVLDEWITIPLRERLDRCVADGAGDNTEITKRVRSLYREWKTQQIDEQLDDVLHAAYGHGAYGALAAGDVVQWVASPARQACADCDDNTLAGAVAAGQPFPTGQLHAPAHHGCRCLLQRADHSS